MPDWLSKDFHWKAFSLLMAIGIWLSVRRAESPAGQMANLSSNTYANVPVLAVSTDSNVQAAQIFPQTVTVNISGATEIMNRLERTEIHAFVNLTGFSSADHLSRDVEVALPAGTTIISVDPPQVSVTIPKQQ
ncbi:MAG TPA: CdaR family protein [Verrucomicrobiae bacterium]|jgi:YbbR domain-containing protein|nr:CdaR family protein [Verrucomicrobiae bacterium]